MFRLNSRTFPRSRHRLWCRAQPRLTSRHRDTRVQIRGVARPFRLLVLGNPLVEYSHLRDVLNRALVNRMPDVELVTAGGPGLPALVASYAHARGLACAPFPSTT